MQSPFSRAASHAPWIAPAEWAAFDAGGTSAHRICSTNGAWVERFGHDLLFNYQNPSQLERLRDEWTDRAPAYSFAPRRIYGRALPVQNADRMAPVLLEGDPSEPVETVVTEAGVRIGLDFAAGYSVGLFLDQRGNRAVLRSYGPRRVLNTFAYTCSFSVVAALAGAETLSVDLSQKSLDRGKNNFMLNGLDPGAHRFFADDVLEALPRLARRKEQFDAIILDPPTFSRGNKGRRFRAEDDLEALLRGALELAAPGARILLSTNCTKLNVPELERIARFSLKAARKNGALYQTPALPDFPRGTAASTVWIQLR
jgi:23S rRNA (cytosine1962-C5)-methyltransferase